MAIPGGLLHTKDSGVDGPHPVMDHTHLQPNLPVSVCPTFPAPGAGPPQPTFSLSISLTPQPSKACYKVGAW